MKHSTMLADLFQSIFGLHRARITCLATLIYSKRKFLDGLRALGLHQIGKLRRGANLRYLYQGPGRPGPGRPKTHDGKVHWDDLSRFERVLHVHFNASLSALISGKLAARQQGGASQAGFSMASVKRRAFNQHLLERISRYLPQGHSLEESSLDHQDLCNYGTITDRVA